MTTARRALPAILLCTCLVLTMATPRAQPSPPQGATSSDQAFRFRSGVDLVNVTVTVTDASGRFVRGLKKEDFLVYEDEEPQPVSHFSNERVPVSLGIVLDTSASMMGAKWDAAQNALFRLLAELLDPADEIFLYRFSDQPILVQNWTTDRRDLRRALERLTPRGQTAMYDAVAESIPLAQSGKHRKKALVVISDGNDTSSDTPLAELKQLIREAEVLVYAIGIDSEETSTSNTPVWNPPGQRVPPRFPIPLPFPTPGGRPPSYPPTPRNPVPSPPARTGSYARGDRVNDAALRDMTDDSGGRTEIIRSSRDLDPATANIADELSRQYFLGYPAAARKDGRWHSIRVEVRNHAYRVRARRGYVAS